MLNLLCEVLIEVSEGVSHCHSTLHIKTFIYLVVVVLYPFPVRGVLTGWLENWLYNVSLFSHGHAAWPILCLQGQLHPCFFSVLFCFGGMVGQCSCSLSCVQSSCCVFVYDEHTPDNSIHWLLLNCYSKDILQWNRRE